MSSKLLTQAYRILRAANGRHANLTGFNINRFKEAATKPVYDPWERRSVGKATSHLRSWLIWVEHTARHGDTQASSADGIGSRPLSLVWASRRWLSRHTAATSISFWRKSTTEKVTVRSTTKFRAANKEGVPGRLGNEAAFRCTYRDTGTGICKENIPKSDWNSRSLIRRSDVQGAYSPYPMGGYSTTAQESLGGKYATQARTRGCPFPFVAIPPQVGQLEIIHWNSFHTGPPQDEFLSAYRGSPSKSCIELKTLNQKQELWRSFPQPICEVHSTTSRHVHR